MKHQKNIMVKIKQVIIIIIIIIKIYSIRERIGRDPLWVILRPPSKDTKSKIQWNKWVQTVHT